MIAGVILQWYLQFPASVITTALISFSIAFFLFLLLPISFRYKLQSFQGGIIQLLLLSFGSLITWQKDISHHENWYGNYYRNDSYLIVKIDEPLVEKSRSLKAEGYVESVIINDSIIPCKGKLLLYFSKDSIKNDLHYGDKILVKGKLQPIKNSGNPGAFNYQRYAAFQGIYHNAFLKKTDWALLRDKNRNRFKQFLSDTREWILSILRRHINTADELGIAEALLIGYNNDLDKDLVQAYSNTGVVHIIAVSGMHLGLIYVLLIWAFAKIPFIRRSKSLQLVLILVSLWMFALITGASASVLRAAVMFSFITVGKHFSKRSSINNSLAASAFVLLCFDPYFLWDVGFQLSYLAVTGIVVFQRPVYNCFYVKNKWIDKLWQLAAVSLSAQLLTFPVCIYYFHQFPNLFLITNIIAVPLSGFILYAEIALVALSGIPFIGTYAGKLVSWLLLLMNKVINWFNDLPFSVWDKIYADVLTTWTLYAIVICFSTWLINKKRIYFRISLMSLLLFSALHCYNSWQTDKQQKLIVYNVPRHQAIDLVHGSNYHFIGDSTLLEDGLLQNFHLKPARIALQLSKRMGSLNDVFRDNIFYQFGDKRIAIISSDLNIGVPLKKIDVDLVILSKNPRINIARLDSVFNCNQYIFDSSNPAWKIAVWRKACVDMHLPVWSVPHEGAFVYDIGI
jgi:competence protein ComEC